MEYQPIIGLEIHVELNTKSKMFCSCRNDPDERRPNVNVCPVCLGYPGVLPAANEEAIKKTLKTGLALNCQIPEYSKFDRKNYFYPDLPKGYQISQYEAPLCGEGYLEIPNSKRIRIRRVHLEEDTGRLIHEEDCSLLDFNRAGIPLMELVTEPDLNSAEEARFFAEELQLILRYLGVSDADMEKGEMRVEANISLQSLTPGIKSRASNLGTKVEVKNLNSFRAVKKAVDYEIKRQEEILESGKKIVQETRGWDDAKGITISQRIKEEAHEYRYFPEPDLLPLRFNPAELEKIKAEIPELPRTKRVRFKKEYGLSDQDAEIFIRNKTLCGYFEKVTAEFGSGIKQIKSRELIKLTANYLITDLRGLLSGGEDFSLAPENFADFITLLAEGKISSRIAKAVLPEMLKTGAGAKEIVEKKGLIQISGADEIGEIVKKIISENPQAVDDFKKGKGNALQFLIGQTMAKTKGRANPEMLKKILAKELK